MSWYLLTRDQKVHQYRKLIEGTWKVLEHKHGPDTIEHAIRRQSRRKNTKIIYAQTVTAKKIQTIYIQGTALDTTNNRQRQQKKSEST